ncbi:MAG: phosphoribosyl-ATP diphosphatase [Candidatus Eisenbacteria bacterium]|nr:phosphoribosyl-ATP diphosphatase [Candidatus Eisenbacteria bacterium]
MGRPRGLQLYDLIERRRQELPEDSHTAKLFRKGPAAIAKKVGEEGVEVAVALLAQSRERVVEESADLLYHLLALWSQAGVTPTEVVTELKRRHLG